MTKGWRKASAPMKFLKRNRTDRRRSKGSAPFGWRKRRKRFGFGRGCRVLLVPSAVSFDYDDRSWRPSTSRPRAPTAFTSSTAVSTIFSTRPRTLAEQWRWRHWPRSFSLRRRRTRTTLNAFRVGDERSIYSSRARTRKVRAAEDFRPASPGYRRQACRGGIGVVVPLRPDHRSGRTEPRTKLIGDGRSVLHRSNRDGQAGRWNFAARQEERHAERQPWDAPLDRSTPEVRVPGRRAHRRHTGLIDDGKPTARPVRPGDILILVQKRNRPRDPRLEGAKHPRSGADRMVLTEQLVIRDLMAAADFAPSWRTTSRSRPF